MRVVCLVALLCLPVAAATVMYEPIYAFDVAVHPVPSAGSVAHVNASVALNDAEFYRVSLVAPDWVLVSPGARMFEQGVHDVQWTVRPTRAGAWAAHVVVETDQDTYTSHQNVAVLSLNGHAVRAPTYQWGEPASIADMPGIGSAIEIHATPGGIGLEAAPGKLTFEHRQLAIHGPLRDWQGGNAYHVIKESHRVDPRIDPPPGGILVDHVSLDPSTGSATYELLARIPFEDAVDREFETTAWVRVACQAATLSDGELVAQHTCMATRKATPAPLLAAPIALIGAALLRRL